MNTYWNNNGKHQSLADRLGELVPDTGSVENPRKNKNLEKFRKASNCYYDLYNNGLCNYKSVFRNVFGFSAHNYSLGRGEYMQFVYTKTEEVMDEIVLAAANEQGVTD